MRTLAEMTVLMSAEGMEAMAKAGPEEAALVQEVAIATAAGAMGLAETAAGVMAVAVAEVALLITITATETTPGITIEITPVGATGWDKEAAKAMIRARTSRRMQ